LVLLVLDHGIVGSLRDGVNVRRRETDALALVVLDPARAVDLEALEGIDGDQDRRRVGLFIEGERDGEEGGGRGAIRQ